MNLFLRELRGEDFQIAPLLQQFLKFIGVIQATVVSLFVDLSLLHENTREAEKQRRRCGKL